MFKRSNSFGNKALNLSRILPSGGISALTHSFASPGLVSMLRMFVQAQGCPEVSDGIRCERLRTNKA